MAETVRVKGLKETTRALQRVNRGAKKALLAGLREGAQPIAADSRLRLERYRGLSTGTIVPRAGAGGVYITQRQGKKTGQRPDFGSLQFTRGLEPAAAAGQADLTHAVEGAFDVLTRLEGF